MLLRATAVGSDFPEAETTAEVEVTSDETGEWRDEVMPYYVHGSRRKIVGKIVKQSQNFNACIRFFEAAANALQTAPAEYDGERYVVFDSLEVDGRWYHLRAAAVQIDGDAIKIVAHSHATT